MSRAVISFSVALALGTFLLSACGKVDPEVVDPNKNIIEILGQQDKTVRDAEIYSSALGRKVKYSVWLPAGYDSSKEYPFLYLLHGYSENNNTWLDRGRTAAIAKEYVTSGGVPMVIIMPSGLDSFYINSWGFSYESFFNEELMAEVEELYHCNGKRAIAGSSMGGFGTLYHIFKYPAKYSFGYAMSPATSCGDYRVETILEGRSDLGTMPRIAIESGLQDAAITIESVREFADKLDAHGIKYSLSERDGGHDWNFWQGCLKNALAAVGESFK